MKIIYDKQGQPDPYVIRANDKFYIYATGIAGVTCYRADRIDGEWENLGFVLETEGEKEFWAPCVIEQDGTYYMYYSSVKSDSRDVHDERIKVAVCDRPDGKFRYVCDVLPPFSIRTWSSAAAISICSIRSTTTRPIVSERISR